jgi:hypothetical protein
MALLNQSVQVYKQIANLLETLRGGQAPEKFTREFLKDLGFKSSNHLAFIPLLKGLGFLTSDGIPMQRYRDFLDKTRWKKVLAEAVKDAYSDIFVLKNKPSKSDLSLIEGKYKSTYNMSDLSAERAARTFLALLELADQDALYTTDKPLELPKPTLDSKIQTAPDAPIIQPPPLAASVGFHYNIQIHLPATKDVEVYNAIFKSLRSHLIE